MDKKFFGLVTVVASLALLGAGCSSYTGTLEPEAMMDDGGETKDGVTMEVPAPGSKDVDEMMVGGEEAMMDDGMDEVMDGDKDAMMGDKMEEVMEESMDEMMDEAVVKEFSMDSFVVMEDGKPKPQFSVKEITVNKGDKVKLKVTVTSGSHNFKLDEFGIYEQTPLNEEVVIEFTADKAGEFVYYCNMPGHRANGHWGTLKVLE